MEGGKSKKFHAASLGGCFGVAFGVVANIAFGDHIFGVPALTVGLLVGAVIGFLLGDKLTKDFDN
ncbi:hypothetical protein [Microbulbifer elongatus]|uniref:hypothetical protein n=1 Tax=Microbulbifer elongatus TaxID=86173 RepID=UPI001CFE67FF|nr:hypothetical protein [Microbulbifer elongatus]